MGRFTKLKQCPRWHEVDYLLFLSNERSLAVIR